LKQRSNSTDPVYIKFLMILRTSWLHAAVYTSQIFTTIYSFFRYYCLKCFIRGGKYPTSKGSADTESPNQMLMHENSTQ